MSDVAGIEELCDLRAAARASASIEAGKVIDSFCCRLEALLRNRQELVCALDVLAQGTNSPSEYKTIMGALNKAKDLDNDQ